MDVLPHEDLIRLVQSRPFFDIHLRKIVLRLDPQAQSLKQQQRELACLLPQEARYIPDLEAAAAAAAAVHEPVGHQVNEAMASKPTVLFVPGAWLPLSNYTEYLGALEASGYKTVTAGYPSLDPADASTADCATDAGAIRPVLSKLVDEGNDVLIIAHSYASMPASAAAKGLGVVDRAAAGQKGGIVGLIFIAAFLVPEGVSCAGAQGGNLPPWILLDNPSKGVNVADEPEKNFSEDQTKDYSAKMVSSLKPHSNLAFQSPQPPAAHNESAFKGRLGYQVTKKDYAVPEGAQHGMMMGTGLQWIVHETDGSHMAPFANKISESVDAVNRMVEQFAKA